MVPNDPDELDDDCNFPLVLFLSHLYLKHNVVPLLNSKRKTCRKLGILVDDCLLLSFHLVHKLEHYLILRFLHCKLFLGLSFLHVEAFMGMSFHQLEKCIGERCHLTNQYQIPFSIGVFVRPVFWVKHTTQLIDTKEKLIVNRIGEGMIEM